MCREFRIGPDGNFSILIDKVIGNAMSAHNLYQDIDNIQAKIYRTLRRRWLCLLVSKFHVDISWLGGCIQRNLHGRVLGIRHFTSICWIGRFIIFPMSWWIQKPWNFLYFLSISMFLYLSWSCTHLSKFLLQLTFSSVVLISLSTSPRGRSCHSSPGICGERTICQSRKWGVSLAWVAWWGL